MISFLVLSSLVEVAFLRPQQGSFLLPLGCLRLQLVLSLSLCLIVSISAGRSDLTLS